MATLERNTILDSHWYTREGQPLHKVKKASGDGERSTTLRDARKLLLLPSVTTIFNIMSKSSLERWKTSKVIEACKELKQDEQESDYNFEKRVIERSNREVQEASELGSKIHEALEFALDGADYDKQYECYVKPVLEYIATLGLRAMEQEVVTASNEHGYAGRVDLFGFTGLNDQPVVIDFKTRKTTEGKPCVPYEFQPMQISAYANSLFGTLDGVVGANIFISTTEIGRMEVVTYDSKKLKENFKAFKAMLNLWRFLYDYDPRS